MGKKGDFVEVFSKDEVLKGTIISEDSEKLMLKLKNGYNLGLNKKDISKIKTLEAYKKENMPKEKISENKNLKTILILHCGGTLASKIDYKTGGVSPQFSPEQISKMFPELKNVANIKSELVFQIFSEDLEAEHWQILARKIKNYSEKVDGIIITHGTDNLAYTSAALSFMLQNLSIPVLVVGAQRSSDRGSSDSSMNLICAANFISKSDFAGVAICMHGSINDKYCYILPACKTRKLHTSRRDAFKSINVNPIAKVYFKEDKIEFLIKDYKKKNKEKLVLKDKLEKKVAILKARPGVSVKELLFYEKNGYKGLIIEGTGLGHYPILVTDKYTKEHKKALDALRKMAKKMIIVMTSSCIFGKVNMDVYKTGRELLDAGIISGEDMLTETAFVKLSWLLGNYKDKKEIKNLMRENLAGEIERRIPEYDNNQIFA